MNQNKLETLALLVETGKKQEVIELVEALIVANYALDDILHFGLLKGMNTIGTKWKQGQAFIPEVLVAARALNAGMELITKNMPIEAKDKQTKIVIGTVKGDMHDIGKNLVIMMLKAKGFEVIDLGINVDAEDYVEAVKRENAPFVCMSALLTTTMLYFKEVVSAFIAANMRQDVIILGGGAPVTQKFATDAGCDYYANDALDCANLIVELVAEKNL